MGRKYELSAPKLSSEELALLKIEEMQGQIDAILAKLDLDGGVLDVDYNTLTDDSEGIRAQIRGNLGKLK